MERREFIKTTGSLCIFLCGGAALSQIVSCSSMPIYKTSISNGSITVPLSVCAEGNVHIIRPENYAYDIVLTRSTDGNFSALLLRCTHADNQLTYTGNNFRCPLHGSTFDEHGMVTHGPAQRHLLSLNTKVSGDDIIILLP